MTLSRLTDSHRPFCMSSPPSIPSLRCMLSKVKVSLQCRQLTHRNTWELLSKIIPTHHVWVELSHLINASYYAVIDICHLHAAYFHSIQLYQIILKSSSYVLYINLSLQSCLHSAVTVITFLLAVTLLWISRYQPVCVLLLLCGRYFSTFEAAECDKRCRQSRLWNRPGRFVVLINVLAACRLQQQWMSFKSVTSSSTE